MLLCLIFYNTFNSRHVAGEMEQAINELLKIHANDSTVKLQVIGDNPFANGSLNQAGETCKP